ncbi:endonuclease [Aureibacter tunicatorum]|uniref:Endonuclease I n=1 Tax=Aureibacter tunicatorum TaxID=866807 RepID=A0AAE3XNL6_9BACT|nr:endonuclease [Aureibacter tunicatorum]MDR6239883.1 endonuclease I [Aureibacter tunicatorum]BDD04358.1 hypothetical protein AUTU_18410 [Aureibacter tunicatorum]
MKQFLFILFLAINFGALAQVPSYYDDVNINATGLSLKYELANKISSTHTTNLSYTPGVWNALKSTDLTSSTSSKVFLIYGYNDYDSDTKNDRTRSKNDNGGGSTDWNREHVYPKSLANPNLGTSGAGADAHNLRASDTRMNSTRGSRKFADGSGNSGVVNTYWYPGDEWKGDVARMIMYMYLRYGNRCLPSNVGIGQTVSNDNKMIALFLEWNAEDPVSEYELQRNPILENLQGNRNPFIDNPAFATAIWGGPQAENRFGNNSGGSNSGTSNQLFISEYIEGSSYNKAIEIVNLTGDNVDLSDYSLKKQINGSGSWSGTYSLSGTLAHDKTFVISHSSATSTIRNKADETSTGAMISFNGNDPIGLFYNNQLIDIVGNFNGGSSYFGKDVTLIRNSDITDGNTSFNKSSEWTAKSSNYSSNLGLHNYSNGNASRKKNNAQNSAITEIQKKTIFYPNPANDIIFINIDIPLEYSIFNNAGQLLIKNELKNKRININNFNEGIYFLKLEGDNFLITEELIIKRD